MRIGLLGGSSQSTSRWYGRLVVRPEDVQDPLYRDVALPYAVELPVLGVPVRFEVSVPQALAAVERAYGAWGAIAARPELVSPDRVRVRLCVQPGDEGGQSHPAIRARMPDNDRLLLHTTGSIGLADAERLEAHAYVTAALLASGDHFQHGLLDALTLFLVTQLDRQPVHAAGIARGGVGLLLAGPSGAGKSSLAYVAVRAGYDLLGDDTVYAQLTPRLRVWGLGRPVVLPRAARECFPDLGNVTVVRRGDDMKLLVTTGDHLLRAVSFVERVGLCLLARTPRLALRQLTSEAIVSHLRAGLEPGFDRFGATIGLALAQIAARGAWRLDLAGPPQDSLPYLDRMLAHLAAGE
jgi:hypothetical protein